MSVLEEESAGLEGRGSVEEKEKDILVAGDT